MFTARSNETLDDGRKDLANALLVDGSQFAKYFAGILQRLVQ